MKHTSICFLSVLAAVALTVAGCTGAPRVTLVRTFPDGNSDTVQVAAVKSGDCFLLDLDVEGLSSVELCPEFGFGVKGEPGWFFENDGLVTRFDSGRSEACRYDFSDPDYSQMSINGYRKDGRSWLAVKDGMKFESLQSIRFDGDAYSLWDVYDFTTCGAYEHLSVRYYPVGGQTYSDVALKYREILQKSGEWISLKDKVRERPELAYFTTAPEIRIRMAWKPSPSPVGEQTAATEPPMHIAIDFDRVCDIIDALQAAGVKAANLCLVGWNIKGHDGRFPDIFPADPELGGEAGLKKVIEKARNAGYTVDCHTNRTDIYSISEGWDGGSDAIKREDGTPVTRNCYGGGNMYDICMIPSYDKYFLRDEPALEKLGIRGLHFIDVLSIINPHECHDPAHPQNRRQSSEYMVRMLKEGQEIFGGIQSEGGKDFTCKYLDYALYATRCLHSDEEMSPVFDEYLPVWHIVYNGSVMSNPSNNTVNFPIKPVRDAMKVAEYAGRPIFYFYSSFKADGSNWMGGALDLRCGTEEELENAAGIIRKGCDEFDKWSSLLYETMDRHEEVADGVYRSTFSDGSVIECDYNTGTYSVNKAGI